MASPFAKNRHVRLSSRIADDGKEAFIYCSRFLKRGLTCMMSSSSKRCSGCIRSGRQCVRELISDIEWDEIEQLENENEIDFAISKRADAQSRVSELQSQLAAAQSELAVIDTKFVQLSKQKRLLKDRGSRLLVHDSALLAEQDSENPPNPSPAELNASWDLLQSLDPVSLEFLDQSVRHQELVASLETASSTQGNSSSQ
jgi:hypothetical protein